MSETSSYADTWPGMATEIAALRTLATAAERRMESLEERLAAIERAATCGTGPNEPMRSSPAQAAVGEASASSPEQPPFQVGDVVECVQHAEPFLKAGERGTVIKFIEDCYVPERNGVEVKRDGHLNREYWYASRFRLVTPAPSPASVASEPSAGAGDFDKALSALYAEYNSTHWRDRVDANMRPVFDKLRAENERLKDDYQVAVNNIAYRSEELVEANREIERLKALDKDYCDSANKYAQEIGRLREQLATSRAAAEAMEWLEAHEYGLQCVYVVKEGKPPEFVKSWKLENYSGRYPTPTAAILAAKAASGTNTGERT